MPPSPRALLSTWDKTGIVPFAEGLVQAGFDLISTGGTARTLREAGLEVIDASEVTGHPEVFDGRVKTLHPAIHAPLLARLESGDAEGLSALGYDPIQVVAVNLYPFAAAAAEDPPLSDAELLEMIDIGGPTLLRAAAKNHRNVLVISDPSRYEEVLNALDETAGDPVAVPIALRRDLALTAFEHTAGYDAAIANALHRRWIGAPEATEHRDEAQACMPASLQIAAGHRRRLRYGENHHQAAALYLDGPDQDGTLVHAEILSGKPMSYNNYADADACLRLARALSTDEWPRAPHACVIVKHANPCGAALAADQVTAYRDALESDPESAFGSIVCFNETVTRATAEAMRDLFIEVIMAPAYDNDALEVLKERSNRRILRLEGDGSRLSPLEQRTMPKRIEGGWLVQTEAPPRLDPATLDVVTSQQPDEAQMDAIRFGQRVCEQVKSNAIVMIQGTATVGIGPGQTSRVEAVRIASRRAGSRAEGCILISDAFFPFPDGIVQAAEAGASLVVQPGGSIRDEEVIAEAEARGLTMVFTHHRLFRH